MKPGTMAAWMTVAMAVTAGQAAERPFLLWTKADIAKARKTIETEPWAQAEYEKMLAEKGPGDTYRNLFRYLVMKDDKAGEDEKKYLLSFTGAPIDPRAWSDHYLTALRYDCLHADLTDEQRKGLEDTFRKHVENQIRKFNWLPNMQWPRPFSAHLLAVALQDKDLIRQIAAANGGWKYYFDSYVSDGGFYNEEFGKMCSMVGEMLLWCRGLERLGMDDLGYGYVAKTNHNACMRSYLKSIQRIGLPRVNIGTERCHYPRVSMGDAKGGAQGLQHAIVAGYGPGGDGGNRRFMWSNMNGRDHRDSRVTKMLEPQWFEIAHQKWPEDGWDYFLVQMRAPDQDKYYPSLFWGLEPMDPAKVKPPAAPCGVYPERGLVVLRAEEGPEFWEGPWPAVGLRLGTAYAHSVPDCFTLTGFHAFNQPLYSNRQVSPGYAGTDPGWSSSIRSHCGVMVDNREPVTVGVVPCRSAFGPLVKFCSARGREIYPGVDMTRTLFLTKEYLADITALASERARSYHWMIHGLGYAVPDNPNEWAPSRHLLGAVYELAEESSFVAGDRPWAVTMVRKPFASADPAERAGVRLSMLGTQGTVAHAALAPMTSDKQDRLAYGTREPGMPSVVAARNVAKTAFAALHEPYRNVFRVERFERIQETADAIAVRVAGEGINDRLMVRWGDAAEEPVTLSDGAELFEFAGYAFVRVGRDRTDVVGDLRRMRLAAESSVTAAVFVNGKEAKTRVEGGYVYMGDVPAVAATLRKPEGTAGAVSCRWFPQTLCLATGGKGQTELSVRNVSRGKVKIALRFAPPEGVKVSPAETQMELAPGAEQAMGVEVEGDAVGANRVGVVEVRGIAEGLQVQNCLLTVAQGVVAYKDQIWPRQFSCKVFSPRYTVRYEYWTSTAATFLLDPAGLRRFRGDGAYPTVYRMEKDAEGRERSVKVPIGGFQGFSPALRKPKEGGPAFLEESGTHPHGYYSDIEYRFTEDWIWMRYKRPGTMAFDWSDRQGRKRSKDEADAKWPELLLVLVDGQKSLKNDELNRYEGPAAALFDRPAGHEFGAATFYPEGATNRAGLVWQPADQPLGFTFCREEELAALLAKWRGRETDKPTQSRQQGDVRALSPH